MVGRLLSSVWIVCRAMSRLLNSMQVLCRVLLTCAGDDELADLIRSLPSRDALQGLKMMPAEFEKVHVT